VERNGTAGTRLAAGNVQGVRRPAQPSRPQPIAPPVGDSGQAQHGQRQARLVPDLLVQAQPLLRMGKVEGSVLTITVIFLITIHILWNAIDTRARIRGSGSAPP